MKGWEQIPRITGDLDLIVEPRSVPELWLATLEFLSQQASNGPEGSFAVECSHIPGVPRILAFLPAQGFAKRLFEVDFATVVPIRGYPGVTYENLLGFYETDAMGYPRTNRAASDVLDFLFKSLGWYRIRQEPKFTSDHEQVLEALFGPPIASAISGLSTRPAVLQTTWISLLLLLRATRRPSFVLERARFRLRGLQRVQCPFDPRRGRDARIVNDAADLWKEAVTTNHTVQALPFLHPGDGS